jgi:hypothetical protein
VMACAGLAWGHLTLAAELPFHGTGSGRGGGLGAGRRDRSREDCGSSAVYRRDVVTSSPKMLRSALDSYLNAPEFGHAIDAVPFIIHGGNIAQRWSNRSVIPIDSPCFAHLFWSLKRWTALLGAGPRSPENMYIRLAKALPQVLGTLFIAARGSGSLVDGKARMVLGW